jgi:hypothetical protein
MLLFDDLILNVPLFSDESFDLSLFSEEGLMARGPHNMFIDESGRKYIPESMNACDLYEAMLYFEPFLLPLVWPYLMDITSLPRLKRLHITDRIHLWRTLFQIMHDMHAAKESRPQIAHRYSESLDWARRHSGVAGIFFDKLFDENEALFDSFFDFTQILLKQVLQIVGIADECEASLLMHRKNAWYAPNTVLLPSQEHADQRSMALTAIRTHVAEDSERGIRDLTVKETLRLRKQPEVVGLRTAVQAIVSSVSEGQESLAVAASREVMHARKHLARQALLGTIETLCTYTALPLGVAETALALPPIAGLSVAATAIFSNVMQYKIERKDGWVSAVFERR